MPSNGITVAHKFIRNQLFQVSQVLFRAGPGDVPEVQRRIEETWQLLEGHASQEEAMLGPALDGVDAPAAERLTAEHRRLDTELERVRAAAKAIDASDPACAEALQRLQLDWNRVVADYLVHLDEEERTLFIPITDRLPPMATIARRTVDLDASALEAFLRELWQVVTPSEKQAIQGHLPPTRDP